MNIKFKVAYASGETLFDTEQEAKSYCFGDLVPEQVDLDSCLYIGRNMPPELRDALCWMAYERGHSAGESEVALVMRGLVADLEKPVADLIARIKSEPR